MVKKKKVEGIVDIHGKEYRTVAYRNNELRQQYTIKDGWGIETEMLVNDETKVIMYAKLVDPNGKISGSGHAEEFRKATRINKTSAVENAETSAIGRALASAGFAGTEFASADELSNALINQKNETAVETAIDLFDGEVVSGTEWHHSKVIKDFKGWAKLVCNKRNNCPDMENATYDEATKNPVTLDILEWAASDKFEANRTTQIFKARAQSITEEIQEAKRHDPGEESQEDFGETPF
ncbi:MAG: hypothetical protein CL793_06560 [Chloroflexi bacterium]|nr:hypothetical protein [Chloroflexota bacterium]|tara:strand:- start:4085 stop:4798 length:714 start_codon:yes stop_codon:yes gene_type:complete